MEQYSGPNVSGESALVGARLVPIGLVRTGRQPRRWFDPELLAVLTDSIRERGILQPLLVREDGRGGYLLIVGERRLRAAHAIGMTTVPVVIRAVSDAEAFLDALVENIVRANLTLEEQAKAYQRLLDGGLSQREIARRTGVNQATISRILRLWADETLGDAVATGALGQAEAQELLTLPPADRAPLIDALTARRRAGETVSRPELRALVERQRTRRCDPASVPPVSSTPVDPGSLGVDHPPPEAIPAASSSTPPSADPSTAAIEAEALSAPVSGQTALLSDGVDERARSRARSRARALRLHVEVEVAALGYAIDDLLVREDLAGARRVLRLVEPDA
jgi:ParB/RepB/Spo0J family partition protein